MRYEDLLHHVLVDGEDRTDRTGTGTLSLFAPDPIKYSLADGTVPLTTTKRVAWQKALRELLWMLSGSTNIHDLGDAANVWAPWADADGDLGPVYGAQWRRWNEFSYGDPTDQLAGVLHELRTKPDTRRAVMSSWNVGELPEMALPPCPVIYQFSRRGENGRRLDLHVYQRSADLFLGVPFDLFEFAVLARLIARELGVEAGTLTVSLGDTHIYRNHLGQVGIMLERWFDYDRAASGPRLVIREDAPSLLSGELQVSDFMIEAYHPQGPLAGKVAV